MREDDNALVARASRGDTRALDELLRRQANRVHAVCRRILNNPDDALDATQEALLSIARKVATFDGRAQFSTWCYRIATNAALDEARKRNRRPLPSEAVPDRGGAIATDSEVAGRLDVDAALAQLTPEYRAAVALRDLIGMDYAEIGEVLGIPPGTVRSRIARGRAALADLLGNHDTTADHPSS